MKLYNKSEKKHFLKKLPRHLYESKKKALELLEPNFDEIKSIRKIIVQYIKKKKRILYGGYALHLISNNEIYDEYDLYDIEIYSPDVMSDMIQICDLIKKKGYQNIVAEEAIHKSTISIYINFQHYLDITHLSTFLISKIKTFIMNDITIIDKKVMLIDFLNIINDPITSNFRFEKIFNRFFKLLNYIEFDDSIIEFQSINLNYLHFIFKHIVIPKKFLLYGFVVHEFYKQRSFDNIPFIEIISYYSFDNDIKFIHNKLKNEYKNVNYEIYHKFHNFLGERVIFYIDNNPVIHLIHNNSKCIPFIKYDKFLIVTFLKNVQLSLINALYYSIFNNSALSKCYNGILYKSSLLRHKHFIEKKTFKDSLFEETIVDCKGEPISEIRKYRLNIIKRKSEKKKLRFRYIPPDTKPQSIHYNFKDYDGKIYRFK